MQNELIQTENGLVPVYRTSSGERVVYGSELHEVLGIKTSYKDWSERRLSDIDALEHEDFEVLLKNERNPRGGRPTKDHVIKLDTAKEMAMLERNDKGKQVRRYFIEIEKRYRTPRVPVTPMPPVANPMQELSPQLQLLINMELKQKETNRELLELKDRARRQDETIQAVKEAMMDAGQEPDFSQWVSSSIKRIAESKSFEDNPYRYQSAWNESYKRLTDKAGCDLNVLLKKR